MDRNKVDVSIIIPVYNVEPYIADCLNSVASQTYGGQIECIIVDDRGNDNSIAIARQFIAGYKGDIYFKILSREQNGGLSAARNSGMRVAAGAYIYFLDSDDELTPTAIKSLMAATTDGPYDFVIADYITTGTTKSYPKNTLSDGTVLNGRDIIRSYCRREWYMMAWNKLYRRGFLIDTKLEFYEGIIHEDELWSFQCATVAKSIKIIDEVGYIYKLRENSITTANQASPKRIDSFSTIVVEMAKTVKKHKLGRFFEIYTFLQKEFVHQMQRLYLFDDRDRMKKFYADYRHENSCNFFVRSKHTRLKRNYIIRDLHFMLPSRLGMEIYCKLLDRIMS